MRKAKTTRKPKRTRKATQPIPYWQRVFRVWAKLDQAGFAEFDKLRRKRNLTREQWVRIDALRAKSVWVCSIESARINDHVAGRVFEVSLERAAMLIAGKTHRAASGPEILEWYQDQNGKLQKRIAEEQKHSGELALRLDLANRALLATTEIENHKRRKR